MIYCIKPGTHLSGSLHLKVLMIVHTVPHIMEDAFAPGKTAYAPVDYGTAPQIKIGTVDLCEWQSIFKKVTNKWPPSNYSETLQYCPSGNLSADHPIPLLIFKSNIYCFPIPPTCGCHRFLAAPWVAVFGVSTCTLKCIKLQSLLTKLSHSLNIRAW